MNILKIRNGLIVCALSSLLGGAGLALGSTEGLEKNHRFVAVSPDFELVGILEGTKLSLWLDRAPTNEPVVTGTLDLELGDLKVRPRLEGETWVAQMPADWQPDSLAVVAKVASETLTDLLAGEWVWHEASPPPKKESWWKRLGLPLTAGAGMVLVLAVAARFWRQRRAKL